MKYKQVDKTIYRERLNKVIIGFIAGFSLLAIGCGQLLISLFSSPELESNFRFNLTGVIIALVLCGAILHRLRKSEFFTEIYYVWQIKQIQNQVFRKLKRLSEEAFECDNIDAIQVLAFYYHSQIQVYQLDDNTLTLNKVYAEQEKLNTLASQKHLTLETDYIDTEFLNQFK